MLTAAVVVALVVGLGSALISSSYRTRVESIVLGNIEGSNDKGSLEARKTLLKKAFMTALNHPLLGVGPGCFILVDKGWVVAHNTYGEIAAESGLPALALFLLTIGAAFKNIAQQRKSPWYRENAEFRLFTQALWACLVAYLVGAAFASTELNMYPYFMVAYTCVMARIATQPIPVEQGKGETTLGTLSYGRIARPEATFAR
jgi:O-antigen ligase